MICNFLQKFCLVCRKRLCLSEAILCCRMVLTHDLFGETASAEVDQCMFCWLEKVMNDDEVFLCKYHRMYTMMISRYFSICVYLLFIGANRDRRYNICMYVCIYIDMNTCFGRKSIICVL